MQSLRPHRIPAYQFWSGHFRGGLEEGGHQVLEVPDVDWAAALVHTGEALERWRSRTWSLTVEYVAREHQRRPVDLFLGYLFPAHIETAAVDAIRRLGIPTVNFFCDNVRWFRDLPRAYSIFDLHWVPEKKALPLYRAAGMRALHAPMPCWVMPEIRNATAVERLPPTFVGSRDRAREELFAAALKEGAVFDIRGPGWANGSTGDVQPRDASVADTLWNQAAFIGSEGWLPWLRKIRQRLTPRPDPALFAPAIREAPAASEYEEMVRESMVAIGVNRYPSFRHQASRRDSYSRLRDIEAPMLGACYLTEWTEGLDDLYDLENEVETYRTPAELAVKLEALRADPPRRAQLRRAGQRRALSDHTVPRTIARVAHELGL